MVKYWLKMFAVTLLKKAHLNFRPGAKLRDMQEIVKFKIIAG